MEFDGVCFRFLELKIVLGKLNSYFIGTVAKTTALPIWHKRKEKILEQVWLYHYFGLNDNVFDNFFHFNEMMMFKADIK